MVPRVPITPTRPLRVSRRAALTPGPTTPHTGTGMFLAREGNAAADAVLQAMTIASAFWFTRKVEISQANSATIWRGLRP